MEESTEDNKWKITKTFQEKMATHSVQCPVTQTTSRCCVLRVGHGVTGGRKLSRISLSLRIIVLSRPACHIFSSSALLLPQGLGLSQNGSGPQAGLGRLGGSQGSKCHCGISLEERKFSLQTSDFSLWFSICGHEPQV